MSQKVELDIGSPRYKSADEVTSKKLIKKLHGGNSSYKSEA